MTDSSEFNLKQEVIETYTEVLERVNEMAHFIREITIIQGKCIAIKNELDTSPRAATLVSLSNSISSDSSGISGQLHQMAEELEEMIQILGSF